MRKVLVRLGKSCLPVAFLIAILMCNVSLHFSKTRPTVTIHDASSVAVEGHHGKSSSTQLSPIYRSNNTVISVDETVKYCSVVNATRWTTDVQSEFQCVKTRTSPPVDVCVYDEGSDKYISHDIIHTGVWEPQVLHDIQEVLRRHPNIAFIDLGANIGYYTLIAARMGHKVIAVEPLKPSLDRIMAALKLSHLSAQVTVLSNGVGGRRSQAVVIQSGDNQGDTRVHPADGASCTGDCPHLTKIILLDDLLEVTNINTCIIKMDIQGYEVEAVSAAEEIFEKLDILYLFMEWGLLGSSWDEEEKHKNVQMMIGKLWRHGFRPYALSTDGGGPLDTDDWKEWPFDIVWHKVPSLQDLQTLSRNHFLVWPS